MYAFPPQNVKPNNQALKVFFRGFALFLSLGILGQLNAQNAIVTENALTGNLPTEWDVSGAGDPTIQGFATDLSVNRGSTISFKINTDATAYHIDIYRLGYYGGRGARKVATINPSVSLPQIQPNFVRDTSTGLVDCGNWAVSASWSVPSAAVSGVYIARPVRTDTGGASHIIFVVRNDASNSDMLFQTSDTTWHAYNLFGGADFYRGNGPAPGGRCYKVSYNRPFMNRDPSGLNTGSVEGFLWDSEYPMIRWLEANGYNVSYATDLDSDRRGVAALTSHKIFLSNGHDEYWSGQQRTNVEAARAAGVHLAFFSANEMYWKTRWENSIAGSVTSYRTLVCYKETIANAKIDPSSEWTGTWRDPRFSPPADGGRPENAVTGTMYKVDAFRTDPMFVPAAEGKMRFWRNTGIDTMADGQVAQLPAGVLGFEWDEVVDNGFLPHGLFRLSKTTLGVDRYLQDFGYVVAPGIGTHSMTLYRHSSGALVFGAGTTQWSWGLDATHDRPGTPTDSRMQQATVNLFADMAVQPATLQPGLVAATQSTDVTPPTSSVSMPLTGTALTCAPFTITGSATDAGGKPAGVEYSTDGGTTWHIADGSANWSATFTPTAPGLLTIRSRAVDDSGRVETNPGPGITIAVVENPAGCTIWPADTTPAVIDEADVASLELGVRFQSDRDGYIKALRFYKCVQNSGQHTGHLWTNTGTLLGSVTFTNETPSGWQEAQFSTPILISAGVPYVASYHIDSGHFSFDPGFFTFKGVDRPPLHALASGGSTGLNGVFNAGATGFPTGSWNSSNYWVDVVYSANASADTTAPTVSAVSPANGASGVDLFTSVSAQFDKAMAPWTTASSNFTYPYPNALFSFTPALDSAHQDMLRDFKMGKDLQFTFAQVPSGPYDVYLWTFEDNNPLTATISVNGNVVGTYASEQAGRWRRLGPFATTASNGNISVRFQCANDVAIVSGLELWTAGSPLPQPPPTFYRAINLGGPAMTIDGNNWEANTGGTPNFSINPTDYGSGIPAGFVGSIPGFVFNPSVDTVDHATMLRTFRWNHDLQFALTSVPRGSYQVYVWTCEPNAPLNAALSIEENVVLPNYNTGPAGHWDRLGPFPVTVDDGNIAVRFTCIAPTATSFLSGIEVWQAPPLPPQAGTFYRGINVGGPATVIDGHNWEADGAPNFTFNADPFPFSLKDAQNNNVPAAVTYDVVSKTAQLQPLSPLNSTATYTATLKGGPSGLTDFMGNSLPSNVSWSFTTRQASQAATPTFSPVGGTYSAAQSVSISDTSAGTQIYYTTNGSTPTIASTLYTGPISVSTTTTIKAIAAGAGWSTSEVASASYTIQVSTLPHITSTASGGNWNATTTWVGGVVPTASHNVTIADGATVTINTAASALTLGVGTGSGAPAILQFESNNPRTITVATYVVIASNGTFKGPSGNENGHVLSVGTDLINNGVLDFYINGNRNVGITFTGSADASFTLNAGSTTDLRQDDGVILNKGTSKTPVLTFTPGGTFTVEGGNSVGFLTITNGTFKISGTGTFSNPVFNAAAYTIPATGGFWLDDPNYTVTGLNGSPTNNGLLRVSQGTLNVGTNSGNAMGAGAGAIFTVEGGTLNFAGRLNTANAVTYTQSAGTVNITTVGNSSNSLAGFGLSSGSSVFNMSGGAINLVRSNTAGTPVDYQVTGTANITGGILNIGTAATPASSNFRVSGQAPNIIVNNTTNNKTATLIAQTNVWGDTTISTGATVVLNGFTLQQIGATFTNNGTLNGTTANSALNFVGSAAQAYAGTGTTTASLANFGVDNPFGLTLSSTNNVIASRVVLLTGSVTNSNKITLGNGGSTTGTVQIGNTTTPTAAGSFDVPLTFNLGSGGEVIAYLRTTSSRSTGGEINPTRSLTSFTYDDNNATHKLTVAGADLTVTGGTTFTNGQVVTGANNFIVGSAGTVNRTNGYVQGNLRKTYTATGSKTFEVGTDNGYSPVAANVTTGTFPAVFTAKAVQGKQPNIPGANALSRYWTLAGTGLTANLTFNYLGGDVVGTEANYKIVKYNGSFTQFAPTTLNTTTHVATLNGVSSFSDWTLAEPGALLSSNANLSNLTISAGTLTPAFASGTTSYTASVSNAATSITETPTVADATATVKVNGTTVASGSASAPISLNVGDNVITTVVTAQDGTTRTYTVTVTRAAATFTLTYTAGANGTISGTTPQTVTSGANGTPVTAVPNAGYHFVNWSDSSTANPRTDTNVMANVSVTANFAINTYTLTYTAGANGTITGTSPQTVNHGADGTPVTAVPNAGYHFVNWSDASTANPRADTNVTANVTVTANFAINTYTLTYAAGANGTITGTSPQTVNHGANGTPVTAVPNAGYHFVNWSDASTANPRTDTNVTANVSVTANFAINTYTLTYTAGANGSITGTSPQTVNHGANGTAVTAVPDAGYHFVNWSDASTANPRTDTNVTANVSVTANFAINTYTLTYTAGANGTITGTSSQTVNHGGDGSEVTAGPNAGYHFVDWSDGVLTAARIDTNVTADISVTANFAINSYTLTYMAGANETITGISPQTVNHGADGTEVTAVPNAGYHFVDWSDGVVTAVRTDTNVTANVSVTANFAISTYALTYTAGANGSITGTSPQTVNYGGDGSEVIAVPNTGYHFVDWSDGVLTAARTDTNVTANVSVTANFAINTYTLTYTAGANGSITGTSPQTVNHGADGTLVTAVPNTGCHFVDWSDGVLTARTDTNVTANVSVTANFAIDAYTLAYTAGANGSITGTSPQTVNHGADGTLVTAVPNTGCHFVDWSDGVLTAARTDTNVTANVSVTANFAINTYTLAYTAGANGSITGTSLQTVNHGADGTPVTAVPNTDYHFVNWSDGSTENPRTDTNVTADISVTANFAINTYTLTYTAGANGTIFTGTSPQTVNYGADGTPRDRRINAGYHFVDWSDGVLTAARTDTNVTANVSVTANFAINTYTLTYTAGANGTITGTSPQTVNYGTDGTEVTAVPNAGYHFVNWSDGVLTAARTDTNVTANVSVTANFAINTYTLIYTAGANGSITGTSPQTVNHGADGSEVTAVPNAGYHFVDWSDGVPTAARTDTNVMANVSVTANFAINTYTLTYTAGANGTITGTSPQTVNHGANGTPVTAVPDTGYHFVDWSDGVLTAVRTDTNVTASVSVTANFAINTYTLTYTAGANGTITGTSPQTVNHGANGTPVTAVPDTGYHFVDWSDASTANPRTDTNVTANISVTANFAINTYTLTYTAGANGTITEISPQTVNHGADGSEVAAIPNTGYHFVDWSDGVLTAARTDTNVTANVSVTANFAINTYTLTYTAGANGAITGISPQTVNHGADGTEVTAVQNAGYHFVDWSDGVLTAARTDTNVTASVSVTANFAINTYTLTYTAGANGSITGTSPQTVNHGANGTLVTAVSDAGYHFVDWSDASTANPRTDTNVTANISVTANFAINTYTLTYTAGANGTITGISPQTVNHGADGTPVTAVANTGYHFVDWSDGSTTNPRTDTNVTANVSVTANFAINTYTLTYTAGANGTITGTSPQTVDHGADGTPVTAVPNTGYHFVNWSDASTANPRTDTNVTANVNVTANFAINTYTLTYTAGTNGTITGTSPQTVNHGADGTSVTAVPNAGYHFVDWSDASTANPRTDINVTANVSVTANFAINTYTLTYTAGANGMITGISPQTVNYGANGSEVTAVPNAGYHFVNWSDASTANPRTDINVTTNVSVTANFAINTYTLTYTAGANGSITGISPQTVNHGANGTLVTAVPDTGYHFVDWSDGVLTASRTDTNVTANVSVTANFAINIYTLTYTAGANGMITGISPQTVNHGADGTLVTAVPNAGYHFVDWSDGVLTAARTDTNVTANVSVTANFAINTYTLTYTAGANGSITGTSPQTVNHGADGTPVTAVPNAGYHFVGWSDGVLTAARTDTNVTTNVSVAANFAIDTYTLTYAAGPNGSISGTSPQTVNHGANGTPVMAVPNTGYHFVNWSDASTENPRTDTNVTANVNVTANFAINTYTLTYTAGANGTITGTSPQTVNYGGDGSEIIAVPNTGYHFVDWSDGVLTAARTDTNVTANITVTANFAINTYILTYTAGTNGTITGTSPQTVNHGADGTPVTAVPNTGYHFVNWSDASTENPRTDTNVTANVSVTANFAINTYTLTYTAGANGTISGSSPQTVNYGSDGTPVTAVPNTGYHFVNWSDASTANPRTDTNATANVNVTANFAINTYTLTYTAGANGSISGTSPQTVNHGGNGSEVTAIPNTGYHFVDWSDGVLTAARTETNVTANVNVTANFAINTYTLTYTAGANGTITGISPQTVNHGADGSEVTAVPNTGYHFVDWSDGSAANPRTDTDVTANVSVTANFAINTYTLTYTAGANGTITGTSPQTVNHGADGTSVTAVPNTGYHFVDWSDGVLTAARTDTNVTANVSVTANFAINTYTLTYTAGANGTITGTSPQTVNHGANGTLVTAVPNTGYHFVDWSDGVLTAARTDTNVMTNVSVTANFAAPVVTNTSDGGVNSLRQALLDAEDGDTITFNIPTSDSGYSAGVWTITLTTGELVVNKNVTIRGPGADVLTVRRDPNATAFRIFHVSSGGSAALEGMTISNGIAATGMFSGVGGGVYNDHTDLTLNSCALVGNSAEYGGAVFSDGNGATASLTITNSTLSGNTASSSAGGVYNYGPAGTGSLTIFNSTLSGNSADIGGGIVNDGQSGNASLIITSSTLSGNTGNSGGGIVNQAASVTVGNTILKTGSSGANIFSSGGSVTSSGYNLSNDTGAGFLTDATDQINTDPILGPLKNNGGPTLTHAPLSNSPAIDRGKDIGGTGQDQRSSLRPVTYDSAIAPPAGGDRSDIGAVELPPGVLPVSAVSRKTHGGAVDFDINLPLTGVVGVECRSGGATNAYRVIVTFAAPVTFSGAAVNDGTGSVATSSGSGTTTVTVDLTGVTNAQRITIALFGVDDTVNSGDVGVRMGVLIGDTSGNGNVSASDVSQTKARAGQPVNATNFRSDVTVSNSINAGDVSLVKSRTGTALP